MGLTVDRMNMSVSGRQRIATGKITFDSSYLTGGESLAMILKEAGINTVEHANFEDDATYDFRFDHANTTVVVHTKSDDTQVAGSTDLSAVSTYFFAVGR